MCDKQMTITWDVNDLKVSHADYNIVDSFLEWTKETYEYVTNLKPARGKIHDYL